jgi:superoxide dismutase, Fe-Mn family
MGGNKRSTSPRQFAATAITRRKLRERTAVAGGPRTLSAAVPAVVAEMAVQPSPAHAPLPDEPSTIERPGTGRRGAPATVQEVAPIAVRPSMLSGISEQAVVSHYEHIYGNAVRRLNAVRRELAALDAEVSPHVVRGLKGQEISLMGSVALHELYFGNLGGFRRAGPNSGLGRPDWHEVPDTFAAEIAADFGSANAWRREFVAMAQSLAGDAGWVLLTYARRQKRFLNHIATDHTQATVDAAPVLVLDMYEHAYEMDYGANATAYIDAFFKNINWDAVLKRIDAARNHRPPPNEDPSSTRDIPSLSVEELAAQIAKGNGVQIVDARQRDHMSRDPDLMAGATWRDPDRVEEWVVELIQDKPVAVYCSYGFDVGCNVAKTLAEHGLNARFVRGGLSAWYASGGARALKPTAG